MTKLRWGWVAVLLALGALMFGACGGGDDDDDTTDEPQATEPAGGEDEPEEEEEEEEEEEGEEEPSGGGDTGEFVDSAQKFIDASFKTTYNATFAAAEDAPGSFTMYKSGTEKFRFDATSVVDGVEMKFIFISAGDTSGLEAGELGVLLGVEAGEGVCFANDPTMGSFDTLSEQLNSFEEDELSDAEGLPDREVAGETVKCGRSTEDDGTSTEVCFTDDGVLAYLKSDDGTEFTATDLGGEPSDSDFELPYEVKEFPGIPGAGE
jgi:hypothetical protein